MDFSLTEEQELLLASIRELITTNFPEEYFRTCDQNGTYPREFMRALADNGISMLGVPEEFGGILRITSPKCWRRWKCQNAVLRHF